jgi:hypothetical protein
MKKRRKPDITKIMIEGKLVDEAITKAVQEAVRQHIRAGNPIAVEQGGKVRLVKPSQPRRRSK